MSRGDDIEYIHDHKTAKQCTFLPQVPVIWFHIAGLVCFSEQREAKIGPKSWNWMETKACAKQWWETKNKDWIWKIDLRSRLNTPWSWALSLIYDTWPGPSKSVHSSLFQWPSKGFRTWHVFYPPNHKLFYIVMCVPESWCREYIIPWEIKSWDCPPPD